MKGVFCLEGFWYGDHRDTTSVYPVLDLVRRYQDLPFVHHRCATVEEFVFSLERWKTKAFHRRYPLLYLAFHGEPGKILIGKESFSLDQLADLLGNKCSGVVIYFGSCATMKLDRRKLQAFMQRTETVALLGYKQEVDWLTSASFEIRLLSSLLLHPFDSRGIQKIDEDIKKNCRAQVKELDFCLVPNERVWFPRRRK
ncbi:MAG: hypothetical protein JNL72_04085 [Flavipsychrobacter sp.]|nr:hypothetical protein [Flavipsychrobacter sp.]